MKTNKLPFIRWYASDFLAGTRGMKASEVGIYTILLNLMYEQCKPLPIDIDYLSGQCGCRKQVFIKALEKLKLHDKIIIKDDGLWNERVHKEFTFRAKKSFIATQNANERWKKPNKINGNSMQTHTGCNAKEMLYQKPEAIDKKEVKNIKKDLTDEFELFWIGYGKIGSKKTAFEKYKIVRRTVEYETLARANLIYEENLKGEDWKKKRHLSSWLNQEGWNDVFPKLVKEHKKPSWQL